MRSLAPTFLLFAIACGETASSPDPAPAGSPRAFGSDPTAHSIGGGPAAAFGPAPDPGADPVGAALHARVLREAAGRVEDPTAIRGTLVARRFDEHPVILIGTFCYLLLAEGAPSIGDLDVVLVDANGVPAIRDPETGPSASVGRDQPLCPFEPSRYNVRVEGDGPGEYVIRIFRAPNI